MFGDRNNVLIEPPAPASPVSGLPGAPGGDGEVHLLDRLSVLYRYRKIVFSVVLVVMVAGVVQTLTTTPEYRSTATIQIEEDRPAAPGFAMTSEYLFGEAESQLQTQIQILQSRDLIKTIVGPLDLANNGEFNGQDAAPTGLGAALSSMRSRVMRPIRALLGGGSSADPAPSPGTESGAAATEADARIDALVSAFTDHLHVERLEGRLVNIHIESRDPAFAAKAANALAEAFREQNLKNKTGQLSATVTELSERIKAIDLRIADFRKQKENYLRDQNAAQLADPTTLANMGLQYQAELSKLTMIRDNAKRDYDSVSAVPLTDPKIDNLPAMLSNADVRRLKQQLTVQKNQLELKKADFAANHPEITKANDAIVLTEAELAAARANVVEQLKQAYLLAEGTERAQQRALDIVQRQQNDLRSKGIGYSDIDGLLKADEETKAQLVLQQSQLSVTVGSTRNNVNVVNTAIAPLRPFKPDVSRNLLISLFVGFALAGLLAFGLDYLDDTIKTPEDITRKLRIPFLGLVPSVRGDKQPVLSGPVPHDFGEAYRALRTSLVFTSGGESTRIITCTSAQPLEGKTTTACNLAMVLAFGGSRVLLIDADMRRPGVHKALKINNTVGLSHLLVGQARVREAIQRTSDPNFCVMTAGRTPPNPSELLSSERMKQLIANLKQGPFDWVVIDTPPVLAVTDAVILTPLVDGVTFVLGAEMTRRRLAERAVQMLMVSRPKVVGAVLNRVNFDRNKYYYSRYYGYQYKSYYGSSAGSTSKA